MSESVPKVNEALRPTSRVESSRKSRWELLTEGSAKGLAEIRSSELIIVGGRRKHAEAAGGEGVP